jgi:hypothetical protein
MRAMTLIEIDNVHRALAVRTKAEALARARAKKEQ